jgi:DNA helicase-2/ATP-dependent DNA helicase PcrA
MLEEERRLFYVGITRAERRLYLSHARSRRRNGEEMHSMPSSFLRPIPEEMLEQRATPRLRGSASMSWMGGSGISARSGFSRRAGTPVRREQSWDPDVDASQDAPAFVAGERVRHPRFGAGTITDVSGSGRDAKVTVDFDDEAVGEKRLVIAYAGLERGWD